MIRTFKFLLLLLVLAAVVTYFLPRLQTTQNTQSPSQQSSSQVNNTPQQVSTDDCPLEGLTRNPNLMALNQLKNRSQLPQPSDFDTTVTLSKMLAPGDDHDRWNTGKAAEITGYVYDVKIGGVETCNCKAKDPSHRDTHIELVLDPMKGGGTDKVIVEVTPAY